MLEPVRTVVAVVHLCVHTTRTVCGSTLPVIPKHPVPEHNSLRGTKDICCDLCAFAGRSRWLEELSCHLPCPQPGGSRLARSRLHPPGTAERSRLCPATCPCLLSTGSREQPPMGDLSPVHMGDSQPLARGGSPGGQEVAQGAKAVSCDVGGRSYPSRGLPDCILQARALAAAAAASCTHGRAAGPALQSHVQAGTKSCPGCPVPTVCWRGVCEGTGW